VLAVDPMVRESGFVPTTLVTPSKVADRQPGQPQGIDMKRLRIKSSFRTGCLALAVAATGISVVSAQNDASLPSYKDIFLAEITTAAVSELPNDLSVTGEVEVVRERYADGKIHIERQITLDGDGSYVNHGAWKEFLPTGNVVAEGRYHFGQRVGIWTRWISPKDSSLFNEFPYKQFKPPFLSQANFVDGKMEGDWIVADASDRKVLAVSLKAGERHGTATTWLPNGKVFRQVAYEHSIPVGEMLEINPKSGEVAVVATFDNGRKVVTQSAYYPRGRQLKSQIDYLAAKSVAKSRDDFWSLGLAEYESKGANVRHGSMKKWYGNGQLELEGRYTDDKKTGAFRSWHQNGQLASTGEYLDDQPAGEWVWWYETGQKATVGKYEQGKLVGNWRWWDEHGKLTKQQTYTGNEPASADEVTGGKVAGRNVQPSAR
jgi:antitoxin component YwqK of YwqJK toxin-antitoxin module